MSPIELAYLAGIMDGEGSISITQRRNKRGIAYTYSLHVSVTNTNLQLLEWIKAKTGAGKIEPKPRQANWKVCHHLVLYTFQIKAFLEPLLPYMIVRKTHAKLMLEFLAIEWKQTSAQKEKPRDIAVMQQIIHDELLVLNKRGLT